MKQFPCGCAVIATEDKGEIRTGVTALCPEHELGDFKKLEKEVL